MSTWSTVSAALETALQGIEETLGFADGDYSQLHDYLLDHELPEKRLDYLKGDLADGTKATRAIGFEVLEQAEDQDQLFAAIANRDYAITIGFYYEVGVSGSGITTLKTAMRAVRGAIRGMGTELSGTVDRVRTISQTRPRLRTVAGVDETFLEAYINMEAFETNATF